KTSRSHNALKYPLSECHLPCDCNYRIAGHQLTSVMAITNKLAIQYIIGDNFCCHARHVIDERLIKMVLQTIAVKEPAKSIAHVKCDFFGNSGPIYGMIGKFALLGFDPSGPAIYMAVD